MGWGLVAKAFLASIILSLLLLPLKGLGFLLDKIPYMQPESSTALGVRGVLAVLLILVYMPLICYVAGSWVGFCKRINPAGNKNG